MRIQDRDQQIEILVKGKFAQECGGCPQDNARYWNRHTGLYYCAICARRIDIDLIYDICQPVCFEWPLHPDDHDRSRDIPEPESNDPLEEKTDDFDF